MVASATALYRQLVDISDLLTIVIDDIPRPRLSQFDLNTHSEMNTLFRARPGVIPGKRSFDSICSTPAIDRRRNGFGTGQREGSTRPLYSRGQPLTVCARPRPDGIALVHAGVLSADTPRSASPISNAVFAAMHTELDHYLFA